MKTCYREFTTRNSLLHTSRKSPCSEKPSTNSCQESNTSNPNLPSQFINMDFCIAFTSVRGSMVSTITRTCAGRSGVQILDGARELCLLQNIQIRSPKRTVRIFSRRTAGLWTSSLKRGSPPGWLIPIGQKGWLL